MESSCPLQYTGAAREIGNLKLFFNFEQQNACHSCTPTHANEGQRITGCAVAPALC